MEEGPRNPLRVEGTADSLKLYITPAPASDYVESVGIYYDARYSTDQYETEFGIMPGEVIRLDAWFKQNVYLGDVKSVKFTNQTAGKSYKTKNAIPISPIWSCFPDYDCAPGYEILLPVTLNNLIGDWKVKVDYNMKGGVPINKEVFSFYASEDYFVFPPRPVQGEVVNDVDGTVTVEWDAVLGPPNSVAKYFVRIYADNGNGIVDSLQLNDYIPGSDNSHGRVQFIIPADYHGRKARMEQRWDGAGGVAVGSFVVSRSSLYFIIPE